MLNISLDSFSGLFEQGRLPRLLYTIKQEPGNQHHIRPLHSHDTICEFIIVYAGMGVYHSEGKSFAVERGDIIYTNQNEVHELVTALDHEVGCYCFGITDFHLKGLSFNHLVGPESAHVQRAEEMLPLLIQISEFLHRNFNTAKSLSNSFMLVFAAFISLILDCRQVDSAGAASEHDFQLANRIRQYIDKNFQEDLTLATISEALNCSAPYVSHTFKDIIGYSPIHYLTRLRVGLAQNYLITTDYTITHIATLVGYNNTNYFSTVFTKMIGLSPAKFRKRYLGNLHGDRRQI